MIDHVSIAVSDLGLGRDFYAPARSTLGLTVLVEREETVGFGKSYPEFWINLRSEMAPVDAASGAHVCLRARSTEAVQAFFDAAIDRGGTAENAPKFWPEYNARYFAAFVRDPDGNRIEVVHFTDARQ
ncbi:MAG TPA: VOC family protein [Afifellaceae bacterium]|nr:VOC family protein [Afifellaceae bacterium]